MSNRQPDNHDAEPTEFFAIIEGKDYPGRTYRLGLIRVVSAGIAGTEMPKIMGPDFDSADDEVSPIIVLARPGDVAN